MSTSCLYGFKKDGKLKLAYNHSDSYPNGFGKQVVLFVRENTLEELNEICNKIKLVNRKELPNDNDIKEMIEKNIYYKNNEVILNWEDIFWVNDTFLYYYKKDFFAMPDFSEWLSGCQDYLYIINLDINKFEVYKMKFSDETKDVNSEFEKYKLLKKFDLENIPKDWENKI